MNALKTVLDELDSETSPLPKRIMVGVLTLREAAAELAELKADNARLRLVESAAKELANNLPEFAIEEAREIWLNTNTRIILDARKALAAALKGDVS